MLERARLHQKQKRKPKKKLNQRMFPKQALEAQEVQEAVEMAEVVEAEDPPEEPNGGDQVQSSKDTEAAPDGPSPASDVATECLKREGESDGSEPPAKKLKQ